MSVLDRVGAASPEIGSHVETRIDVHIKARAEARIGSQLSGLRGLAALGVVITHYHYYGFLARFPVFKFGGQFFIFLFFFLSSFLLSHSLETGMARGGAIKATFNYAINRVFRIFPMLVLMVFLTRYFSIAYFDPPRLLLDPATNSYVLEDASFRKALLDALTLGKAPSVLWTIPVELTFYLILPGLFFCLRFVRGFRYGQVGMIAGFAAWCLMDQVFSLTGLQNSFLVTLGIHHYVNILVGGVVGYLVLVPEAGSSSSPTMTARTLMPIAPLAFPVFMLLFPYFSHGLLSGDYQLLDMPDQASREAFYNNVVPFMPLLIGVIFVRLLYSGNSLLTSILQARVFQLLGFASFSIYLLHVPIIELWRVRFGLGTPRLVVCLVVTVAVSWLCASFIERTFIQMGKRLNLA
jgi:peptidoglycan/LPS O-acetylase OafA/YrhL